MKRLVVTVCSVFLLAATPSVFSADEPGHPTPGYGPESYAPGYPMHRHPMPPSYGGQGPYGYAVPPRINMEKGMYEEGYLLRVYPQGMKPEDIQVQADGRRLRLSTDVSRQNEWQTEEPYFRSGSSVYSRGSLKRTISLPRDADSSKLTTSVEQGVLEIRIPWYQ
jgi:HSP20 family molecular chaperone IbpA